MPDDGGPDIMVYSHEVMFGEQHKGQYEIKFAPAFWRRLYAGLAMQVVCPSQTDAAEIPGWLHSRNAGEAYKLAEAVIAEATRTENADETDDQ